MKKKKYRHIPWNRYNLEKYRDINFWSYRPALIESVIFLNIFLGGTTLGWGGQVPSVPPGIYAHDSSNNEAATKGSQIIPQAS